MTSIFSYQQGIVNGSIVDHESAILQGQWHGAYSFCKWLWPVLGYLIFPNVCSYLCIYIYTHASLSLSIYMYIYVYIYIYILYIHLRGRCHIMDWMQVANFLAKVRYIKVVHTLDIVYIVRYQLTWFWMILGGVTISRLSKAVFDIAKFEFPRPYFTRNLVLYLFDGCCKHMGIHIVAFTWDPRADCS